MKTKYYSQKIVNNNDTIYIGEPSIGLTISSGTHKFYACSGSITITSASVKVNLEQCPSLQITNTVGAKTYRGDYGIGDIFMSANAESPVVRFGGTWERYAQGRALVGVDEGQTEFNVGGKDGGEKENIIDIPFGFANLGGLGNRMYMHNSGVEMSSTIAATYYTEILSGAGTVSCPITRLRHSNLQPYKTVYIWRRTSYQNQE